MRFVPIAVLFLSLTTLAAADGSPRYYCLAFQPRVESAFLHTTLSDRFAFAYRSALQECRFRHPTTPGRCEVRCLRIR